MNTKRVADGITGFRALLSLAFVWLGLAHGRDGLPWAVVMLLVDWTGDGLDGFLARRSSRQYRTWVGDHDLEVDMAVAAGLLAYMVFAGFVDPRVAAVYVVLCGLVLLYWQFSRALGMLCQAPVYGWFIWVALHHAPVAGWTLIVWLATAVIVTWPRFPQEVIPGFLEGMRQVSRRYRQHLND